MVLISTAAALVIYPLVQGREQGWPAWMPLMIAAAVPLLAVFGWYERRVERRGGDPLVVPALFGKRAFSGGLVVGLVFFSAMAGFSLIFSLYVQLGLGYSPLKAGLAGVPWSLGMVAGFGIAQAVQRFGRTLIHAGTAIMAGGVAGFVLTLRVADGGVTPWALTPALLVTGLGMALLMAPFFDIVLAGVQPRESGTAGGVLTAIQQLGAALGVALLGTVFFELLGGRAAEPAPGTGAAATRQGFDTAMTSTLWLVIGMLALTFMAGFLLPRHARPREGAA
jgi:hypothetical protein